MTRRVVVRLRLGSKILRIRRGDFRTWGPLFEGGPFRCWAINTRFGNVSWELARWS